MFPAGKPHIERSTRVETILHGGKCVRCGYDKCSGALEFHHIDPSQKDFTISNDRAKLEESIEESKKCILLCANCHRELHAEIFKITEVL